MYGVGGYLRALRKHAGLTQHDVAAALGVERNTVGNWEAGRGDPTAILVARYVELVHGSAVQVHDLMINPRATSEDGEYMARVWIGGGTVASSPSDQSAEDRVYTVLGQLRQLTEAERLMLIGILSEHL
jgi:transcriptional regulator with XRE-family HTH domain